MTFLEEMVLACIAARLMVTRCRRCAAGVVARSRECSRCAGEGGYRRWPAGTAATVEGSK